jgi:hypothetical protein
VNWWLVLAIVAAVLLMLFTWAMCVVAGKTDEKEGRK